MQITNIEKLGTTYTVTDTTGQLIKTIQVIPHADILDAALGEYISGSFIDYLQNSVTNLEGFEHVNPNAVLWYATSDEEVILPDLIEYAVKNGYDKIILEHLEFLQD